MVYRPNLPATVNHFRRNPAENDAAFGKPFAVRRGYGKFLIKVMLSSICSITRFLHRYPSHPRPAYSPSRSARDVGFAQRPDNSAIGYRGKAAHVMPTGRTVGGPHQTTTIGLRLCKRHQSSLQQWQYLVWRVASTMTWSAAWPAQVQASLHQSCSVRIKRDPLSPVQPQACFATTQALLLANRLDNRALSGRITSGSRQRGLPPLAAFSF